MRCTSVFLSAFVAMVVAACAETSTGGTADGLTGLENARFLTGAQPLRKLPKSGMFHFAPFEMPDDPRFDAGTAERRVRAGITRELTDKGYVYGGTDPVFVVRVRLVLDEKVDAFAPVRYAGKESPWIRPVDGSGSFEKGALIIDLLDPKDEWTLWRGVCAAQILVDASEKEKERRVELIVRRLLEGFPPE